MLTSNKGKMLINQRIGFRLRVARSALDMTQAEAAEALGVSQGRLSMYETGQRTLDHEVAAKFVEVIAVDFNFIFGGKATTIRNKRLRARIQKVHREMMREYQQIVGDTNFVDGMSQGIERTKNRE